MKTHRNPRARLPKRPTPDNFDPGFLTDAMTPAIDVVLEAALQLSVPARTKLIDRMLDHLPPFERRGAFLALRAQAMELSTSERAELAATLVLGLDELIDEDKVMFAVALYRLVDLEQVDPDTAEELRNAGILLAGDGLKPSSQGKRIAFDGPRRTVVDGLSPRPANWSPPAA